MEWRHAGRRHDNVGNVIPVHITDLVDREAEEDQLVRAIHL